MIFRDLEVPDAQEFLEALGVEPEPAEGSETTRSLDIEVDPQNKLIFSFDVLGRSVRCLWYQEENLLLDLFREGATHVAVEQCTGTTSLTTRFETESLVGRLDIQVYPRIIVRDQLLFS